MIKIVDAVVWVNYATHEVMVWSLARGRPEDFPKWDIPSACWCDPIPGWTDATNAQLFPWPWTDRKKLAVHFRGGGVARGPRNYQPVFYGS
jgi:hypothetical protein